ncbi:F-type H+-transporting ATPase subunit a [Ereboglobus sp. PH5-10]|uniref:F0F1 ATP synthase subunit A n=1 Tax=Ereboglobus sp. PH5-10 TaxID=2940629 RepID=UPI0024063496|nr:F0F1 ATP synthase subunit A [Ereboglobus sp. PH5-10]MDF9826204.1 F-type H+-transporting ATPase subunit a [Ereboglobus sp. PH5-10]
MSRGKITTLALSVFAFATTAFASGEGEHSAVATAAGELFKIGSVSITNSMVTSWLVALVLIVVVRLAIGKRPRLVPTRAQAMVESLVEGILNMITPIVGKRVAKPAFPLLVGLFIFILIQNWSGLFPGVGTLRVWDESAGWKEIIRPGNADMNMTIALALIATAAWAYFILRYAGLKAVLADWFGNKADRREVPLPIYLFLYLVFFLVGIIEIISIVFRPVSLSFRLFGNVFGGENLLHSMQALFKWGLPIPFYFLEVLIGLVQALVFTLLVSVYIGLICNHEDGHEEAHDDGTKTKEDTRAAIEAPVAQN